MEQKLNTNDAAAKDAQVWHKREEFASGMGQRLNTSDAALKDAQTLLRREECASSMGQKVKLCSIESCTNIVVKGGVCWRHGAKPKRKRCSSKGCTNGAQKGGVCKRHGAYRLPHRVLDQNSMTTTTHPNQPTSTASTSRLIVPEEVAVCRVNRRI